MLDLFGKGWYLLNTALQQAQLKVVAGLRAAAPAQAQ